MFENVLAYGLLSPEKQTTQVEIDISIFVDATSAVDTSFSSMTTTAPKPSHHARSYKFTILCCNINDG